MAVAMAGGQTVARASGVWAAFDRWIATRRLRPARYWPSSSNRHPIEGRSARRAHRYFRSGTEYAAFAGCNADAPTQDRAEAGENQRAHLGAAMVSFDGNALSNGLRFGMCLHARSGTRWHGVCPSHIGM